MLHVWDLSTRLYHWLQAFLFFALLATAYFGLGANNAEQIHTWLGTVLFTLLIWRLGWGIFGSETSRFIQFLPTPKTLWRYLCGRHSVQAGHNPVGALMVIILIVLLGLQGCLGMLISGWVDGKELFGRSGIRTLKQIHESNALLLIILISVHIMAAIITSIKGQGLTRAMISGKLNLPAHIQPPKLASNLKALCWLMCSVLAVAALIVFKPFF